MIALPAQATASALLSIKFGLAANLPGQLVAAMDAMEWKHMQAYKRNGDPFRTVVQEPGMMVVWAEEKGDGTLAGFLMLKKSSSPRRRRGFTLFIWELHVAKKWRLHSVGRRLLESGVKLFVKPAHIQVQAELEVHTKNEGAICFYEKIGFRSCSHSSKFADVITMRWVLV